MKTGEFDKFQMEFQDLLEKYEVTTYLMALAIQDAEQPNTDFPIMLNVEDPPGVVTHLPKMTATFATFIQKALLQMVAGKNGLTHRQARAVLVEMAELGTELLQIEQHEAVRRAARKAEA